MFRFTFSLAYTEKSGEQASENFQVQLDTDNVFAARAELVYRLSRNPFVFAPFSFELAGIEEWKNGKWEPYVNL